MSFINDLSSDNYITNKEDWERIKDYIPKDKVIWSPFYCDGKQKEYFEEIGFNIIHEDEDFFENNKGDIIIDNIPFSKKKEILTRIKELDKPFIIVCPSVLLVYKWFQLLFKDNLQIIIPYDRIKFRHLESLNKNYTPPYASFYFCYKMGLEKDLIFI
tara:strand:- start:9790 stop:10263 length:474 start_codon:yes stop_codon:yes gene_type:complete